MGSMKAFKMEMDSHIADAIDHGATTLNSVMVYVKTMLPAHQVIDENYVRSQVEKIFVE